MPKHTETLKPIPPPDAIQKAYEAKLERLVRALTKSVAYWLTIAYKNNIPEISKLAMDASPAVALLEAVQKLRRRWQRNFNQASIDLAKHFATDIAKRNDVALARSLRKGGFSVRFKMSRAMNDVVQASVAQNVSLIKSIPQTFFTNIEGMVMRSLQDGATLGEMVEGLKKQYGVTTRRAQFITRDQANKCSAATQKVRYLETGLAKAVWVHSHAGFEPRPTHMKASKDKVEFDIREGWYDPAVKKRIMPGELPNCRCTMRPVMPRKVQDGGTSTAE